MAGDDDPGTHGDRALPAAGNGCDIGDRSSCRSRSLTGEPGDVVIGHPGLLHSPSPHRGERPRFMRVQRLRAVSRGAAAAP